MEVHAMDEATPADPIRLRGGPAPQERLIAAGVGIAMLLFSRSELGIATFAMMAIGAAIVCYAAFAANVLWSISRNKVLIETASPFARPRTRTIRSNELSEMRARGDRAHPERFSIFLKLASGDELTSPPIAEVTRVDETCRRIAELLGVPHGAPPANPLDAANVEMRIGEPVRKAAGTTKRIIALIIAGLCTIPYAYKFWNGLPLTTAEIILPPIGVVVAFLLFRYAHTSAGSFWIVRQGELHVERLSRDGEPVVNTITGGDVDTIAVERDSKTEDVRYVVQIDLVSKQKFLSPGVGTLDETRAVAAEIALRLGIASQRVRR